MKPTIPLQIKFETAIKLVLDKELKFRNSSERAPKEVWMSSDLPVSFCNSDGLISNCDYGHYNVVASNLSQLLKDSKFQKLTSTCGWNKQSFSFCEEAAAKVDFTLQQLVLN